MNDDNKLNSDMENQKKESAVIESISDYREDEEKSSYEYNHLYSYENSSRHLSSLITDLGEKKFYDCLAQCNRCGYCETSCPTYMITGRESISARGRNQIIKAIMNGKIKSVEQAEESLFTCLLCGACQSACYGKVQTPEHVLEARRSAKNYSDNWAIKLGLKMMAGKPAIFALWLKLGFLLKRIGFARLAGKFGIYNLLGMPAMNDINDFIEKPPLKFLRDYLKKDPELKIGNANNAPENSNWAYFAPCGSNYIYPRVGLSTINVLKRFLGKGIFFDNFCCGLTAYNYGKLTDAKKLAKKNIIMFEKYKNKLSSFIVAGDCSSCVAFMKTYEQLFTDDKEWRERAKKFSQSVKDILEIIPPEKIKKTGDNRLEDLNIGRVTYHDSCRACHGQNIRQEPREILKKIIGGKFKELNESDWCCGGAGTFAFTQKNLSEKILLRKIKNIAFTRADTVIAGSTSCLMQIGKGLKQHYPSAKVEHFSVFVDKLTK